MRPLDLAGKRYRELLVTGAGWAVPGKNGQRSRTRKGNLPDHHVHSLLEGMDGPFLRLSPMVDSDHCKWTNIEFSDHESAGKLHRALCSEGVPNYVEELGTSWALWIFWKTPTVVSEVVIFIAYIASLNGVVLKTRGRKGASIEPSNAKAPPSRALFARDPSSLNHQPVLIDPANGKPLGGSTPALQVTMLKRAMLPPVNTVAQKVKMSQRDRSRVRPRDLESAVRREVDLGWVLDAHLGVHELDGTGFRCPLPGQSEHQMHLTVQDGMAKSWRCDVHDASGDAVDLYALAKSVLVVQAVEILAEELGIGRRKGFWCQKMIGARPKVGWTQDAAFQDYEAFLSKWLKDPSKRGKALLVKMPPGGGKTTATARILGAEFKPGAIAWFTPRHDLAGNKDFLKALRGPIIMHGRKKGTCVRYYQAEDYGRQGNSVRSKVCGKCPHYHKQERKRDCAYWRLYLRKDKNRVWQHSHLPVLADLVSPTQILVIDEGFAENVALDTFKIDPAQLRKRLKVMRSSTNEARVIRALLDVLNEKVQGDDVEYFHALLYGSSLYQTLQGKVEGDLHSLLGNVKLRRVKPSRKEMAFRKWRQLWDVLKEECLKWEKGESFNPRLSLVRDRKSRDGSRPCYYLLKIRRHILLNLKRHKVVLLDATGNRELAEHALGIPVEEWPPSEMQLALPREVSVWKVADVEVSSLSKYPLTQSKTTQDSVANKICQLIVHALRRGYLETAPHVLLITFQAAERWLQQKVKRRLHAMIEKLPESEKFDYELKSGHFFAQRGKDLPEVDALFVIGVPSRSPDDLFLSAAALFVDQPLDTEAVDHRGRAGYGDPRIAALRYQSREGELYQAAFRVRPWSRKGKRQLIVFVGNLPVPQLEPDVIVSRLPSGH